MPFESAHQQIEHDRKCQDQNNSGKHARTVQGRAILGYEIAYTVGRGEHFGKAITYAELPTGRPRDKIGVDAAGDEERDAQGVRVFRKFTTACRLEGPYTPLYPFGYGLSYSAFEYGALALDMTVLRGERDTLTASVTVRNAGARVAEEIVQLYISDPVASRSRPLRELKGFRKIMLAPGEEKWVSFKIAAAELRFFRAERLAAPEPVFEPGTFIIQIGSSSQTLAAARVEWCADT
jgi:beta-glucosidase